mmetsp:Transcript_49412/g.99506  ORF Transcript_49412/g.99506 Transcript_49412/m.99506 type:complete len:134 (+) Transcript_49412:101-502(+)
MMPATHSVANATLGSGSSHCSVWQIAECGAAVGLAGLACGGPLDPADAACILAAVDSIAGCGACLCKSVGCPTWCPCGGGSLRSSNRSGAFRIGRCVDAGYDAVVGRQTLNVSVPVQGEAVMTIFKQQLEVVV